MFDSPIFNVIFGLIFIFSLLSILVTQLNTLIVSVFNWRGKHLKHGIAELLTDPITRAKFLAHPLIGLVPAVVQPSAQIATADAQAVAHADAEKVEWIPPEMFSQVMLDILNANAESDLFGPAYAATERLLNGVEKAQMRELLRRFQQGGVALSDVQRFIAANISDPADQEALRAALGPIGAVRQPDTALDEQSRLLPVLAGIDKIADPAMRTALQTLIGPAFSLEEAQARLEFWFNTHMDRLSASYRRRMTWLSIAIGLVLSVLLNADTLFISRTLWNDPALSQAIVLVATTSVSSGELGNTVNRTEQAESGVIELPVSPTPDPAAPTFDANAQTGGASQPNPVDLGFQVGYTIQDLLALRLPLGWTFEPVEGGCPQPGLVPDPCANGRNLWLLLPLGNPNWFSDLFIKLVGLAITVIAIAQGAPFWFDLLSRIARGRSNNP
jgi:hypothetical protein